MASDRLAAVPENNYGRYWYNLGDPICQYGSILISAWIIEYIHYKAWVEITYPFTNFYGAVVEIWEWISNFILHFIWYVIIYPWPDRS